MKCQQEHLRTMKHPLGIKYRSTCLKRVCEKNRQFQSSSLAPKDLCQWWCYIYFKIEETEQHFVRQRIRKI